MHSGSNRAFSSFKSDRSQTQEPVIEALAGRGEWLGQATECWPAVLEGVLQQGLSHGHALPCCECQAPLPCHAARTGV